MSVDADRQRVQRYWEPSQDVIRYRSDNEYAEHYLELLEKSVRDRLRSVGSPVSQMSGGLDSTAVVALAAASLPHRMGAAGSVPSPMSLMNSQTGTNASTWMR